MVMEVCSEVGVSWWLARHPMQPPCRRGYGDGGGACMRVCRWVEIRY